MLNNVVTGRELRAEILRCQCLLAMLLPHVRPEKGNRLHRKAIHCVLQIFLWCFLSDTRRGEFSISSTLDGTSGNQAPLRLFSNSKETGVAKPEFS